MGSKNRSVSLQRTPQEPLHNVNIIGARSQSLSRTGDENSARSFLSALAGGMVVGGMRLSRPGSRQSSGDRSSLMSWSGMEEDPSLQSTSEFLDGSVLSQLKKMKLRKPKQVQQADFDELFARGMAMSAQMEEDQTGMTKAPRKKREPKDQNEEKKRLMLNEKTKEDNGIGYAEKVMSYLDDQAKKLQ